MVTLPTTKLTEEKCVPCEGNAQPLKDLEIQQLKQQVPKWDVNEVDGSSRLQRKFTFPDFISALQFTQQVGEAAEAEGHHPLICLTWGEATVNWWTHAIDGLHENDFIMAAKSDRIAENIAS